MEKIVLTGTDEQIDVVATELQKHHGIRLAEYPHALLDQDLESEMRRRGILLYSRGEGGIDASLPSKASTRIRLLLRRSVSVRGSFETLYDVGRMLNDWKGNPVRSFRIAAQMIKTFRAKFGRDPAHVLEIGHGGDVAGQTVACSMAGASFSGVTLAPGPTVDTARVRSFLNWLCLDPVPETKPRQAIFKTPFEDSAIRGPFDLVYDTVVVEHVDDHPRYFAKVAEVLAPSGLYLSNVGLGGHLYGRHELEFLGLSDEEWKRESISRSIPHRLRVHDYVRLLNEVGLDVEVKVNRSTDVPASIQAKYPGRDVSAVMAQFFCRRRS